MHPALHTCGGDLVKQHPILIKWGYVAVRMVPTIGFRVFPVAMSKPGLACVYPV